MNSRAIRNVGQNTENFGNLLFPLPVQEKTLIRKLEKLTYKLNAAIRYIDIRYKSSF